VPFGAGSQPLLVGLGAISLDLVLALMVTGALRAHIGQRAWRAVHWAAYAAWPLAFVHSLGIGTDAGSGWMRLVAIASVLVVGCAAAWRTLLAPSGPTARSPGSTTRGTI
jgi:sulfoxide reductase heme-binding subunit YedZ